MSQPSPQPASQPLPPEWDALPRYQPQQTYAWNYENPPERVKLQAATIPGEWRFCGSPMDSPLGVPAGPLLNGAWCLYYADLGFDVVTYKTVRSSERECYPLPNVQPVDCQSLMGGGAESVGAISEMRGSWAVSFGMPSQSPSVWQDDVLATRTRLAGHKKLVVSVVGTTQEGWSLARLADDYAACARMALNCGADAVEANFSCPNVSTCDGQLYQDPAAAQQVVERVRQEIGGAPLIVKVGHMPETQSTDALVQAIGPYVNAIAATNSIASQVRGSAGDWMFAGERRGICGAAILQASIDLVRRFKQSVESLSLDVELIGVGGASTAADVRAYLQAGAGSVQIATAAMVRPWTALEIRRQWALDAKPQSAGLE